MEVIAKRRFGLDTSSKKYVCPSCRKKTWVICIDRQTGKPLPYEYGRCDREVNCGHSNDPYKAGYAKMITDQEKGEDVACWRPTRYQAPPLRIKQDTSYIPVEVFKASRSQYDRNKLVTWMLSILSQDQVENIIAEYHIGTSNVWPGATVYWQIDLIGRVRAGKIMLYNDATGKRVKEPFNHINWAHKALNLQNFAMKQCFFGEHLITQYPDRIIAIVESEKTAIICSVYMPRFTWLAAGSLTNLTPERCKVLAGKTTILFPDLKCYDRWCEKADLLQKEVSGMHVFVSDLLEKVATNDEKDAGFDLADYLIQIPAEEFKTKQAELLNPQSTDSQITNQESYKIILHYPALSRSQKETNGWETGATEKIYFGTPIESDIRLPQPVEAETPVSVPTSIDIVEYRQWAKKLSPFPKGEFVRLSSMADDAPYNLVFNPRAFAMGRLNSIAAWANARNDSGPKSRHIRQVIELRQILSNQ